MIYLELLPPKLYSRISAVAIIVNVNIRPPLYRTWVVPYLWRYTTWHPALQYFR